MNDLLHRIDKIEQLIQEKEHELQLLKDDLEAVRAALETTLEEQQVAAQPEPEAEVPAPTPEPVEEPTPEPAEESVAGEEAEADPISEEQQHEAIIRTIEEFAQGAPSPRPASTTTSEKPTLADRVGQSHLSDLKKVFGINERFLYANELFNGDMSAFTQAIEEFNHLESSNDAQRHQDNLSSKYKWDEESETVIAFKSVVSRRFA